ncbi:nmrA-like family domain-containing protein 1 [Littorina saxatilis]|uniref:NmrA-like family domain-containing protein 1 n=1 Tax=Littorina saxatilis TaxID=31220 RepID=A0AAN9AYC4_9CAEN
MSGKVVTVFGATGGQGASVARALAKHPDYMVRAITRDVYTEHAQKLRQDGVDLIGYDPNDRGSIESALCGAYAVFVNTITDYNDPNCFENEKTSGKLIADACKAMGVRHVVFSSQIHTTRVSGLLVRHMVAKAEIEDYMRDIGLPVTCLIMPIYYEDFCGMFRPRTRDGSNYELLIPTGFTPMDMMSVEDLGPVVVNVLNNTARFLNKTLSVSGDKLTMREVASVLNKHLAPKAFRDKQLTVHEFSQLDMPGILDWAQMFNFLVREDQRYKVKDTQQCNPNMQSFETWVRNNRDQINRVLS